MCYFVRIEKYYNIYALDTTLRCIDELKNCYEKYSSYFQDDFSQVKDNVFSYINDTAPNFWLIFSRENDQFMGFVSLDNFIGNDKTLYSAEITTCLDKKACGICTIYSAKFFLKY